MTSETRGRFLLWLVCLVGLSLWLGWLLRDGPRIDTNLLSLLPATEQNPLLAEATDALTASLSAKTLFLVGHADAETARDAARTLETDLRDSGLFDAVTGAVTDTGEALFGLYFPYRYQLTAPNGVDAGTFSDTLIRRARAAVYSPAASVYSRILDRDPLLLFPHFLQQLPQPPGNLNPEEGYLGARVDGVYYVMLTADVHDDAFSRGGQQAVTAFLTAEWAALTARYNDLSHAATGVVLFAAAGSDAAESEVSTIGVGSLLGVVLLFVFAFRGPRPLLLGLLPIGVGLALALAVTLAAFGRIHLLTIGFGAGLIGICIDYTFHYFCELRGGTATPAVTLRTIMPALRLGALTSVLGYAGLFAAPFPGLRQMALFSSAGLVGAFVTVVLVFPHFSGSRRGLHPLLLSGASGYLAFWRKLSGRTLALGACATALFIVGGLLRLTSDDDIRRLQTPSAALTAQEALIRRVAGRVDTSRFLLVEGPDAETVLQRQEALTVRLTELHAAQALGWFQALSQVVPSRKTQETAHAALRDGLRTDGRLDAYLDELGFEPEIVQAAREALSGPPTDFLTPEIWAASPASAPWRRLWLGAVGDGYAGVVVLGDITDPTRVAAAAEALPGVHYVDKVAAVSDLMRRYRVLGSRLVALSYLVILLLLMWRYGPRGGLAAAAPPVAAAGVALAAFGWLGMPVTLFHVLALLLVLGIGIDYTIFFAERGDGHPSTMAAVMLSACTTILSFGLLSLSATPVLQAFGLTVLWGIGFAWLTAPPAGRFTRPG